MRQLLFWGKLMSNMWQILKETHQEVFVPMRIVELKLCRWILNQWQRKSKKLSSINIIYKQQAYLAKRVGCVCVFVSVCILSCISIGLCVFHSCSLTDPSWGNFSFKDPLDCSHLDGSEYPPFKVHAISYMCKASLTTHGNILIGSRDWYVDIFGGHYWV